MRDYRKEKRPREIEAFLQVVVRLSRKFVAS
jgi:hypothetical protein